MMPTAPVSTAPVSPDVYTLPDLPPRGTSGPLFFDLETIPDYSRIDRFGLDPLPRLPKEVDVKTLPAIPDLISKSIAEIETALKGKNIPESWLSELQAAESDSKKPRAGIFSLISSLRNVVNSVIDAEIDRRKLLSVTPEFCRIAAIGFAVGSGDAHGIICRTIDEEYNALCHWWDVAERISGPVCGYNIASFDIPVILIRSAILGVTPTIRGLASAPSWDDKLVLDLMAKRFMKSKAMKLKSLAAIYGIPVDAEGVDGSQVEDLFSTDPAKVIEYVKSDVELTRRLYRFWDGYFC